MRKYVSGAKISAAERQAQLDALDALPDDQIRTDLIPEQADFTGSKTGLYYRPIKKQITLRIDADLIDWFRQQPDGETGYQTRINEALREYVTERAKPREVA